MLEQQAKMNHPDLPVGARSALPSTLASISAPLGPSNSSMTTTVCEEQPAGTASVVARPTHTDATIEKAIKEQIGSTLNTLVNEPVAKRARIDVGPQVTVSSQAPNFVMPSLQTSITGGSPPKVAQQTHAAHISQHPGPMAQKSFAWRRERVPLYINLLGCNSYMRSKVNWLLCPDPRRGALYHVFVGQVHEEQEWREEALYNVSAIHLSKTKPFWDELVVGCCSSSSRARQGGDTSDIEVALNNIRLSLSKLCYASSIFRGGSRHWGWVLAFGRIDSSIGGSKASTFLAINVCPSLIIGDGFSSFWQHGPFFQAGYYLPTDPSAHLGWHLH